MASLTKRPSRARFSDAQASGRVAIVSSLFLIMFGAALLIGGRAAIGPLLQSAADSGEPNSAAAVVYTMSDGVYCRHVSFDNVTAQETEGGIERCNSDVSGRPLALKPGLFLAHQLNGARLILQPILS